jgi:hypothetical protein
MIDEEFIRARVNEYEWRLELAIERRDLALIDIKEYKALVKDWQQKLNDLNATSIQTGDEE